MEKKINIAELLKDCPQGMELYSPIFGTVYFEGIRDTGRAILIDVTTSCNTSVQFYSDGKFNTYYSESEVTLFPSKGKTTWEGFVPPCKFKDGDILVHSQNQRFIMSIYHKAITELIIKTHCILWDKEEGLSVNKQICCYADSTRLATEEEKEKLFDAIKENGYRWNDETKTLEKLIEPKFKVGDKVRHKNNHNVRFTITNIEDDSYVCGANLIFCFDDQDNYELVPNKFDITILKPFDKVLVRDCNDDKWNIDFFSYCRDGGAYQCMTFTKNQCIPYEGNQRLLGTANDCDEFYKTW